MSHKQIAVLYHGGCPDGFGGAYAAWKKFGDSAEYIPLKHGLPPPNDMAGRTLYFIDFCYPKAIMDTFIAEAASVTVLDHHLGVREVTESMPEFVFDAAKSGATIAWSYFHPNEPVPTLLQYVQDGDLYKFILPDSRATLSYVYSQRQHFDEWDALASALEDPTHHTKFIQTGKIYAEHFAIIVQQIMHKATLVSFEGFECYLASASDLFSSDVGNGLVKLKPPLALVANVHGDVLNVSLRSDPSVDVSALARKYGGNGHPQASAFRIKWGDPLPWKVLKEHENPRH